MPFDGTEFPAKPQPPRSTTWRERFWATLVIVVALFLLVMPISATGYIDLVRYLRGH